MDNINKRILINVIDEKVEIVIKPHNSILHGFFLILLVSACFSAVVLIFILLAGILGKTFLAGGIAWTLALITIFYKTLAIAIAFRSIIWSLFGREKIIINGGFLLYKKSIAGIGTYKKIKLDSTVIIKEIDYVKPKDIIHMIESESANKGRAIMIQSNDEIIKFGLYLTMEESEEVFNCIKNYILN